MTLLQAAEKGLTKLMNTFETPEHLIASDRSSGCDLREKCHKAMNDDFNTLILISHLFDGVRIINSAKDGSEHKCKRYCRTKGFVSTL